MKLCPIRSSRFTIGMNSASSRKMLCATRLCFVRPTWIRVTNTTRRPITPSPLHVARRDVFSVATNNGPKRRLIIEARRSSACFVDLPGVPFFTGNGFARMEVDIVGPKTCPRSTIGATLSLRFGLTDVRDCFHRYIAPNLDVEPCWKLFSAIEELLRRQKCCGWARHFLILSRWPLLDIWYCLPVHQVFVNCLHRSFGMKFGWSCETSSRAILFLWNDSWTPWSPYVSQGYKAGTE